MNYFNKRNEAVEYTDLFSLDEETNLLLEEKESYTFLQKQIF